MARLKFNPCEPEYIKKVCHGRCCQSSTEKSGVLITIHPSEEYKITARGGVVKNGLLQPKTGCKVCPFKNKEHLCSLHFTEDKPFGCIASPFTLTTKNTLIVRNRYRMLICFKQKNANMVPAYRNFKASLDLLFGKKESERIVKHFDNGGGDLVAYMNRKHYEKLKKNDEIKKKR